MRFEKLPIEKQKELRLDAAEINEWVDRYLEIDASLSPAEVAEFIIRAKEIDDLYKKNFGDGWAEKMMREALLKKYSDVITNIEEAPRQFNDDWKTDAFVEFRDGTIIGLQLTTMDFEERDINKMRHSMRQKIIGVIQQDVIPNPKAPTTSIPLTMAKGNSKELGAAFTEWEANGRSVSPSNYVRKDFPEKALKTMIEFLEFKYIKNKNLKNKNVAESIRALLRMHQQTSKKAA